MEDKQRLEAVLKQGRIVRQKLISRGIGDDIITNTLNDIDYRKERYRRNEGSEGLYESDMKWLNPLLNEQMITLEGLRFQIFPFDISVIERDGFDALPLSEETKAKFPKGIHCLNMHIPDGAIINDEHLFARAKAFFDTYFPEYNFKFFIIRSWIVYPGLLNIISETSNIRKFINYFEIEAQSHTNKRQALQRIYGTDSLIEIKEMGKKSSLQVKAIDNLDSLGVAFASRTYESAIKYL